MPPRLDSPTASNTNAFDYRDDCSDSGDAPVPDSPRSARSQGSRASNVSSASSTTSVFEFKAVPPARASAVENLGDLDALLDANVVDNVCLGKSLSKEPEEDAYLQKAYSLFTKANELRLGNPNVTQTTVVQFISPLAMLNPANSKDTPMSAVLQNLQNKKVLDSTLKNVTVSDVKGANTNCLTKKTEITFLAPDNETLSITLLEMAPDFRRQLLSKQTIAETVKHLEGHDATCLLSHTGIGRSSIMASVLQTRKAMTERKGGNGVAMTYPEIVKLLDQKIEHIEQHRPEYLSLKKAVQVRQKEAIIEHLVDFANELWPAAPLQQRQSRVRPNTGALGRNHAAVRGLASAPTTAAASAASPATATTVKGVELPNVGNSCYLNAAISTSHHLLDSAELVTSLTKASTAIEQQADALYERLINLAKQSPADKIAVTKPNEEFLRSILKDVITKCAAQRRNINDGVNYKNYLDARNARMNFEKNQPKWREFTDLIQKRGQLRDEEGGHLNYVANEIKPEFEARFFNPGTAVADSKLDNPTEFWNRVITVLEQRKKRELGRSALITTYADAMEARRAYMETKSDGDQSKLSDSLKRCVNQFHTFSGGVVGREFTTQHSSSELLMTLLGFSSGTSNYLESCLCIVPSPNAKKINDQDVTKPALTLQPPKDLKHLKRLDQVFDWHQSQSSKNNSQYFHFDIKDLERRLKIPEKCVPDDQLNGKTLMVALEYGTTDIEGRLATRIKFNPLKDNLQVPIQGIGNQVAVFEPVGVVVHSSNTARGGHYYSFINHGLANSPKWQKHNDDVVATHTPKNKKWSEENRSARPTFMYYRFARFQQAQPQSS
jgi:hypothetical protein